MLLVFACVTGLGYAQFVPEASYCPRMPHNGICISVTAVTVSTHIHLRHHHEIIIVSMFCCFMVILLSASYSCPCDSGLPPVELSVFRPIALTRPHLTEILFRHLPYFKELRLSGRQFLEYRNICFRQEI